MAARKSTKKKSKKRTATKKTKRKAVSKKTTKRKSTKKATKKRVVKKKAAPKRKASAPRTTRRVAKVRQSRSSANQTLAIIGLVINALLWPGLGTLIGGDTKKGVTQMILTVVSIPLMIILIGLPILIAVWIWGIVSSVDQIKRSN